MAVIDSDPSDAAKARALGLNGYEVDGGTIVTINGRDTTPFTSKTPVGDTANYTDNGVLVEVYVDEDIADRISNVVVIYTQLMQVRKIGSESVSLKLYKDKGGKDKGAGFNNGPFDTRADGATLSKLEDVDINNDCFPFVSGLKADEIVAIIPVTEDDGGSYVVAGAYKPETVTGALTGAKNYANDRAEPEDRIAIEVTVAGTTYKVANWNYDLQGITQNVLKVTKKDVTVYLDEFGHAMLITDVGSTSDYFILGAWRNQVVNNIVVRVATGWDIKGNAVELNVGAEQSTIVKTTYADYLAGDLLRYTNSGAANEADWVLSKDGVFEVEGNDLSDTATYAVRASNQTVKLKDHEDGSFAKSPLGVALGNLQPQVASDVKTIYVAYNTNSKEVDYVEVKSGMQNITLSDLQKTGYCLEHQAEAAVGSLNSDNLPKDDANIKAIVIKGESKDATINNVGYVYDFHTNISKNENGDWLSEYNVYTMDGDDVKMTSTNNVGNRVYVRFTDLGDGTYRLTKLSNDPGNNVHPESDIDMCRMAIETQGDDYRFALDGERKYGKDEDGRPFVERMTAKAVYTEKDIPYIYTNKNPGGLDLTSGDSYAGMISVYGARILDLRDDAKNKVSNAKELKALIKGDSTSDSPNANGNTVSVDIVYNDNPESDNFRMAYYVVLKGTTHKNSVNVYTSNMNGWGETNYASGKTDEEEPGDTPGTPGVTTLNGVTLMDTVGMESITAAKITPQGNGKVDVTATFQGPAWATVDDGSGSAMINSAGDDPENLTFVATLKRTSKSSGTTSVYETQTFKLSTAAADLNGKVAEGTGSDCTIGYTEPTDDGEYAKDFKINWTVAVNTNQASIGDDTWTVEISDVKWAYAGVKYQLADGADAAALDIVDAASSPVALATDSAGATLTFTANGDSEIEAAGYKAGSKITWTVTEGAKLTSSGTTLTGTMTKDTTNDINNVYADGTGWVVIELDGITKDATKVSAIARYNGKEITVGGKGIFDTGDEHIIKLSDLDSKFSDDTIMLGIGGPTNITTSAITNPNGKIVGMLEVGKNVFISATMNTDESGKVDWDYTPNTTE